MQTARSQLPGRLHVPAMTNEEKKQLWREIAVHDICYNLALDARVPPEKALALAHEMTCEYGEKHTGNKNSDIKAAKEIVKLFKKYLNETK